MQCLHNLYEVHIKHNVYIVDTRNKHNSYCNLYFTHTVAAWLTASLVIITAVLIMILVAVIAVIMKRILHGTYDLLKKLEYNELELIVSEKAMARIYFSA